MGDLRITPIGGEPWEVQTTWADEIEWQKYGARNKIPLFDEEGRIATPVLYHTHRAWTASKRAAIDVPDSFDVFVATIDVIALIPGGADEGPKASGKRGRKEAHSGSP